MAMRNNVAGTPTEPVAIIRRPAVAGYFYPSEEGLLRGTIESLADYRAQRSPARALIVPHGSFVHSGKVAAAVLARTHIPRRCIVLGPSHTGSWMPWSLMARGWYRTPLGDVPIDAELGDALRSRCAFLEADAWAQRGEHAIEAVLPFLQHWGPEDLSIVPLITGSDDGAQLAQAAEAVAQVVRMVEEPVLIIASADFSHYEPDDAVIRQDQAILERVHDFDGPGVMRVVREGGIRMCGAGVITAVLAAARQLGASQVEQVAYATSAASGGDRHSSIGYAGIRII